MARSVDISFDCLPLRSIGRTDIPLDASPEFRARCERILQALARHGAHNAYYLYNAACAFHLSNQADFGMIEFRFEGTALTDESDQKTLLCDLHVELVRETCDWLTEPAVAWFTDTVPIVVRVEFDKYVAAGDLEQTVARIQKLQSETDQHGGFVGMYL
jgi:hypothetical protein